MSNCVNSVSVPFKSYAANDNGIPYCKTNKGTIAGAIMAVPAVILHLQALSHKPGGTSSDIESIYREMGLEFGRDEQKLASDFEKLAMRNKKLAVPFAIIAGTCTLGAGILYDNIRNKKAKAAATDIMAGNYGNIYANGDSVATSPMGIPYYKSTNGVKYGVLSGLACGAVRSAMNCITEKKFTLQNCSPLLLFALGGIIMGSIAQHSSNKEAEKFSNLVV